MEHQQPVFKLFLITLWNKCAARIPNQKTTTMEPVSILHRGNANQLYHFKKVFLLAGMLLCCSLTFGQSYDVLNKRIDSLVKLNLPKSALVEVDKLEQLSRKDKNTAQQIRATIYRMKFVAAIEQNAMPLVIARLKQDIDKADYPVKPVLQSLLGGIYWTYHNQNRWSFAQRTHLEKPGNDITKWDLTTINIQMANLFNASLRDYKREQETPIDVLDGALMGDRALRYLRPTLYDLLVQRALDFFTQEEPELTRPKLPFNLNDPRLFGDSRTFVNLKITTTDTGSTFYRAIQYFQQATLFHLKQPYSEALADLDLHRLEFVNRTSQQFNKEALCFKALNNIATQFAGKPISADALVLIGKHYQDVDSLKQAHTYFTKAYNTFPKSNGGRSAAAAIKVLELPLLTAGVEDVNVPNKPLLGIVNYKMVKNARVIIYQVSTMQFNMLAKIKPDIERYPDGITIYPSDSVFNYLKQLNPVKNDVLQLPGTDDYHNHSAEFKINALPSGHYVLVVKDDTSENPVLKQLSTFKICQLAYVTRRNADNKVELRVLNRETGVPVPNVQVTIADVTQLTTDANGACVFNGGYGNSFAVKLVKGTDTLYTPNRYVNQLPNQSQTYYNTVLFTDRQLYRPGQTVYFKGLQLENTDGKSKIVTKASLTVTVNDNNNKQITTMPQVTNDFGTFAGQFTLPQNILNGSVTIHTPNGTKWIRVEEYKRPSFAISFLPVKGSYKPNDMITLSGKVMAYSGFGLSKARVVYHITRRVILKNYAQYSKYSQLLSRSNQIVVDTIKTDDQGKFEIKFKALADAGVDLDNLNYQFNVSADVTDGSAETRSANASLIVGTKSINILAGIGNKVYATDSVAVSVNNLNNVLQGGKIRVQIYALEQAGQVFKNKLWNPGDKYLMNQREYKKDFAEYDYHDEWDYAKRKVISQLADISMDANDKTPTVFKLNELSGKPTGTYKLVIHATNSAGDTTSLTRYTYLMNEPGIPQNIGDWVTPINTNVKGAGAATFLVGIGKAGNVLMERYNGAKIVASQWLNIPQGNQQKVKVEIGSDEKDVSIQFLMVWQNRVYSKYQPITSNAEDDNLKIKFLTYRDKLQPGEKETWKLRVTGKTKEIQAEMLANMYDASLDDIGGSDTWQTWLGGRRMRQNYYWGNNMIATQNTTRGLKYGPYDHWYGPGTRYYEALDLFGYNYYGGSKVPIMIRGMSSVGSASALNEVMIDEPVGSVDYMLQGRVQGVQVMGYAKKTFSADKKEGGVATALNYDELYDPVLRDQVTRLKAITLRSNFNETAFFYPQLRTNEKGEVLIEFTIPQSLTKWKFRAFAHTQDLNSGYIESTVVTQKQLSISANMPRFLREGDTITVSARLANLTATGLKGKVNLVLLNAINLKPVNLLLNAKDAEQSFDVATNTTKTVSFRMVIPSGIDALTYRLTADAGTFTDGEENTLPVLQNRMLVTESMPMMVRSGQSKSFNFDKLINQSSTTLKSKTLTLEYTQNPAWYALQALPYMMEFPYECSEQIFSRYYANSLGTNLVNKMPVVKQVFDQWKATNSSELLSNLEKNQELKSTLLEETPWLRDATNETEQKKRVALLFDLNKMSYELQTNLDKLKDRQFANGGFPWFGGDKADSYITRHILAGIGQLYHLGVVDTKNEALKSIADKAMVYLDNTLIADAEWEKAHNQYDGRSLGSNEIHAYYTQSYFTARQMPSAIKVLLDDYLQKAEAQWVDESLYQQGMIALTMLRFNKPDVAKKIIASLIERSQQTDELGMYWGKNQFGYFWYQSPISTQCLMIELFAEAGDAKDVEEMKIWLLRSKQTSNWKTTTATAAACYALLLKGDNWLADTGISTIKLDGKNLNDLKPDLKAETSTGYIKTNWVDEQVKPAMGKVSITNNGKTISWGALHWQYLENLDKITASSTDIHLERQYFIQKESPNGAVLVAVDAKHQPKTGDLLKVVVYLKAGRDFEYVQLKDMRPAGTEPVDVLSSYKYQDGFFYYQVTKDVATNFFISYLTKGTHVFEYRLRVAQPGNFSTGISTVQCMYAPEFNAHSEGSRMSIMQ
jgi:uncharacterized protein YfaS (alpha-2-macroglobulin family)